MQFRFSIGSTDVGWFFCGWNIDDFYVFGMPTAIMATVSATPGCETGSVAVSSNNYGNQTFYLRDNSGVAISDLDVESEVNLIRLNFNDKTVISTIIVNNKTAFLLRYAVFFILFFCYPSKDVKFAT